MTIEPIFLLLLALSQVLVLCGALCAMYMTWCDIRLKRTLSLFKRLTVLDCDELLGNSLAEPWVAPVHAATSEQHARKRARLAAVVSGERNMVFKGKTVTPDAEIEELHARYEVRLGAV